MTWIARAPLVTAVSSAGAMGLLENSIRDLSITKREFGAIRAATNQPFGVNLPIRYLQMDPKEEEAIISWLLEQGIHFVTTSAGDPTRYTRRLKDAGVVVYHATATLRGAQKAVDAGVAYVPGAAFYAANPDLRAMRLSFVTLTPELITEGVAILGRVLGEALEAGAQPTP